MTRLGVVGYGRRIGELIRPVFSEEDPELRVVGVVDPDEDGVRTRLDHCDRDGVVFYKTLEAMIRKGRLDALAIGTRCNLHTPFAIKAAKYDLPIYLEKPVAIDMRQATRLERAFENSKAEVVVSFPLIRSPLCDLAKQHIEEGAVGRPIHVDAVNYVPYGMVYWEQGYRNYEVTRGLFLQKATHDFDYIAHLMGSPIVRVGAMATFQQVFGGTKPAGLACSTCDETGTCLESPENRIKNKSSVFKEDHPCTFSVDCGSVETGTNEDCSSAMMEFESGAHGVYSQVFFARRDAEARGAVISGYHGTIDLDWFRNDLRWVRHHEDKTTTETAKDSDSHFGGDTRLARNFLNVIRGTEKSRTPIQRGIQSVYTCLAAKKSLQTGKIEKVRQVGEQKSYSQS